MSTLDEELAAELDVASETLPTDRLERLQALGRRALEIENQLITLEEERVRPRKAKLREIYEREMVDLMDEAGVTSVTVGDRVFDVGEHFHASIKKDAENAEQAYDWLQANEAGDLINYEVSVAFPREFGEEAERLAQEVREKYQMAAVTLEKTVPWKRLASWFEDRVRQVRGWTSTEVAAPVSPPLDLLGASIIRKVSLQKPKRRR